MIRTNIPVSLSLYGKVVPDDYQSFVADITPNIRRTWRRSIRDVGGYWIGSAQWDGSSAEMLDVFQNNMLTEIRETSGGAITWQGFLAEMQLIYNGQQYIRSWSTLANKVKVIYSKMGNNLITNPGCETAVWTAHNTPTVRERSTAWATQGSYSAHIAGDQDDGVNVQSSIAVTAGKQYQAHVTVKIVTGTWRLEIYGAGGSIDQVDQSAAGQWVMTVGIDAEAGVSGNVGLRLYATTASAECYADAAVFQEIADRADTGWVEDVRSQVEYGTIESVVSQIGMTDAAALALADRTLSENSWAKIKPPFQLDQPEREVTDQLSMTFLGYVYTLKNYYSDRAGYEDTASALIRSILNGSEFVTPETIATNSLSVHVEDSENTRAWDLIRLIIESGDSSGNRWVGGVYADRKFHYLPASETPVARIKNGRFLSNQAGPLEGWLVSPGLVAIDEGMIAYDIGDPEEGGLDRTWMNEVEFFLGEYLNGGDGIKYRNATL